MRRFKSLAKSAKITRGRPRKVFAALAVLALVVTAAGVWRLHKARARLASQPPISEASRDALPKPTHPITFAEGCVSARCHNSMADPLTAHAPVAQRQCQTCHAPDAGNHTFPLIRSKAELCSTCHTTGSAHKVQHKALTDDACLACHDPHAAKTKALLVKNTVKETCLQCHPRSQPTTLHAQHAAERCEFCHDAHGADNKSLLRAGSAIDNCRECHPQTVTAIATAPHAHRDVKGSCLGCHAPHEASSNMLLAASTRDGCTTCHADVANAISGATVSHDPVLKGEQCIRCHEPHASDHPKMLRKTQAATCLSCHDKPLTATGGRPIPSMAALADSPITHGAVRLGECTACHSVHGGTHLRLLRELNDKVPLGPFDIRNYALCFTCHDSRLADSVLSTQFRDGDRNLHEIHLRSGERSRGCAACHAVHVGDQPRLIAKTVSFEGSSWAMPMNFSLTPDGGRCGSGCHEPLEYSRRPGGARAPKVGGTP